MQRQCIKICSSIWNLLKQIFSGMYGLIQWTKKFYFFHFLVVYLLPSNLLTIILALITPFIVIDSMYNNSINSVSELLECFVEPVGSSLFFMFFHSICAIILGIIFQVIMMLIQFILKRTILVNNNFFLNNKIYNQFYYYSIVLIIVSWLCLYLFKII